MKILLYLLVPVAIVTVSAVFIWFRNRQPSSLESGVDAFRKEMDALSPDAAPQHRRRSDGGGATDSAGTTRPGDDDRSPRRPPSVDRPR